MKQPISESPGSNLPWLIRRPGRIAAAIVAIAVAYLLTSGLPDELNLLIPYDVGVAVYISLFCVLMERASPEDAAEMTQCDRRISTPNLCRRQGATSTIYATIAQCSPPIECALTS